MACPVSAGIEQIGPEMGKKHHDGENVALYTEHLEIRARLREPRSKEKNNR